jgi:non-ribosomal peptide synthetase component F
VQSFEGKHRTFLLSRELSEQLKTLSRGEGVTLFMTLLACWQALLYRYTNQEEINIGTPIANRNRAETESLIGFFVNTIVIHGDLSGDPSFRELLRRAREVCLGAYAHQDVPFEKLVEVLQPERSLSHTPLVQVWLALQNTPESELKLEGLSLALLPQENTTAKFDLGLNLSDTEQGLICTLEYKTELFNALTISRLERQFETLLRRVVTHADETLGALTNFLVETEKQLQREELQAGKRANLERLNKGRRQSGRNAAANERKSV